MSSKEGKTKSKNENQDADSDVEMVESKIDQKLTENPTKIKKKSSSGKSKAGKPPKDVNAPKYPITGL